MLIFFLLVKDKAYHQMSNFFLIFSTATISTEWKNKSFWLYITRTYNWVCQLFHQTSFSASYRHPSAPIPVKERSDIWLLKQPTKNRYLLQKNRQCWPEATEEYNESICLQNHAQNRPSYDNQQEANTKRNCSLKILAFHEELHGRLQSNGESHPWEEEYISHGK